MGKLFGWIKAIMKLSDKIFIKEAVALLNVQDKPLDYVIESLRGEQSLSFYFDVDVYATESTGYEMMPINENGDEAPFVNGDPPELIEGPGKEIIEGSIGKYDSGVYLSVSRFEYNGKQYCGADSEGSGLEPIILNSESIYFNKSDFDSYVDKPYYQDKSHEHYAPELDLAIQLHKAIHIDKHGNQSQSRLGRVASWLNTTYPNQNFSNAEIERLSAVIGTVKPKK
jgi:hypothetical protein